MASLAVKPMPLTEIVVCTTCRLPGSSREQAADGQDFFEAVQEAARCAASGSVDLAFRVRKQACMSGCSRACVVAFQATGKHTYLIGDLQADAATAADVVACARLHQAHPDGSLAWADRPERLRAGVLARVPPMAPSPEAV